MGFNKRIIDVIKSEETTKHLIYWVAFSIVLDVVITIYVLTSIIGSREKNPVANYLIETFGIVPGLIASITVEIIYFSSVYLLLKKFLPKVPVTREGDWVLILDVLWIVILLIAFILHFKATVNNLLKLFIS